MAKETKPIQTTLVVTSIKEDERADKTMGAATMRCKDDAKELSFSLTVRGEHDKVSAFLIDIGVSNPSDFVTLELSKGYTANVEVPKKDEKTTQKKIADFE